MVQQRTVEVGSRTVRYLESGAGWPLVLLHAFPLSSEMWRPQLEKPPGGWRILAPDLRGFGPSSSQTGGAAERSRPTAAVPNRRMLTLADMAEDVTGWLDVLRIDSAAIGGLSMGGYLTFTLFRMAPERFTAVILANTKATADTPEGRAARDSMSALVRAEGPSAVADQMIPKLLGETTRSTRPDLVQTIRRLIEANDADAIDGAIQAMKDRADATDLLPQIARPTLVIAAEEDMLIPRTESEMMHSRLPRSQLVVLARSGHVSNMETPDDFSGALSNFLHANI